MKGVEVIDLDQPGAKSKMKSKRDHPEAEATRAQDESKARHPRQKRFSKPHLDSIRCNLFHTPASRGQVCGHRVWDLTAGCGLLSLF